MNIEKVVGDYGDYLLRVAYVYVKNQSTAEDIVQDVFIRFYQQSDEFRRKSSLKTYLVKMTVNRSHDYLRSWTHKRVVFKEKIIGTKSMKTPERRLVEEETTESLLTALLSMKLIYREVLVLYYYEESSTVEIAQILNCPEPTIRTRLQRARAQLKERLEEQEGFSHGFD
ncbi:sigma-70 family RNA polymerase sigma factor [Sporosarcina aquimarina]|uniref:Sigma-70 family RNA polymerase sigma factor n=1 Tax=Sporosarcina aquimarina TaxID=114975 RepID=A0ABU4G1R7_9BACL|nr:sigma-70 family RNA polymerase sigma factor [Sporosarcina aquimarina]MDW0110898.1 sigma-70 family RNA polymerase sigma factor [Sporosarcina aquimarina]